MFALHVHLLSRPVPFYLFIFIFIKVKLMYNVVPISAVKQSDPVIHMYILLLIYSSIMFYHQEFGYNSLCYAVGPHCLSILYVIVHIYLPQTESLFKWYKGTLHEIMKVDWRKINTIGGLRQMAVWALWSRNAHMTSVPALAILYTLLL